MAPARLLARAQGEVSRRLPVSICGGNLLQTVARFKYYTPNGFCVLTTVPEDKQIFKAQRLVGVRKA